MPTYELWKKLETVLDFSYPYEKISITFNPQLGFTDVWDDIDFYKERKTRIHPTQKPVKLYEWLLKHYAKPTDKILDTHFGSCSIGIACHNFGCSLDACELDEEYFDNAFKRVRTHVRQLDLFK